MKVLYLFSNSRKGIVERINHKEYHDNHFFSLLRLSHYGIDAEYIELESYLPPKIARFVRKNFLNIYTSHLPLMWKFFSYDIIFHVSSFASQALWSCLGLRRPKWVMYDFSIMGFLGTGVTIKQKLFHFIVKRAAGIITISRKEAEFLSVKFPHLTPRIRFIHHSADIEYYRPSSLPEENYVLTVGLDPSRDYRTLFKATVGLGVDVIATKSHRTKALAGPLPSHVKVKSFTDAELIDAYARAKVFVIPLTLAGGRNDAMGCSTLMEAMAMGKAIVATRTFTMETYITDGENGLLIEEGDAESMRQALARLLEDDELRHRLGRNARAFVEKNCEPEKVASEMADYFRYIADLHPPSN